MRVHYLLEKMGEVIGEQVDPTSRESRFVWARTMVAYQLTEEGYSLSDAGRALGKNHSTILWARRKMKDAFALPNAYRDVIKMWKQFQDKIHHDIQ